MIYFDKGYFIRVLYWQNFHYSNQVYGWWGGGDEGRKIVYDKFSGTKKMDTKHFFDFIELSWILPNGCHYKPVKNPCPTATIFKNP